MESHLWLLVLVMVAASAVSIFYYLRLVIEMYREPEGAGAVEQGWHGHAVPLPATGGQAVAVVGRPVTTATQTARQSAGRLWPCHPRIGPCHPRYRGFRSPVESCWRRWCLRWWGWACIRGRWWNWSRLWLRRCVRTVSRPSASTRGTTRRANLLPCATARMGRAAYSASGRGPRANFTSHTNTATPPTRNARNTANGPHCGLTAMSGTRKTGATAA